MSHTYRVASLSWWQEIARGGCKGRVSFLLALLCIQQKMLFREILDQQNFSFRMSAEKPNPGDAAPQVYKLVQSTISSQSTCKEKNYFP